MNRIREPVVATVAIADLRPTQITVGMREVEAKRKRWRETGTKKGERFLGKHIIPVILGPKGRHYVIDHHHLALALHQEGVRELAVTVAFDLSSLDRDMFWSATRFARSPASCGAPAVLPRTRRCIANFFGRIFFVAASNV
jgi:hypothetical protein